jgi:hypothetical protein
MKLSLTNSRYIAVCLCLFFSYALLISNIAYLAPRAASAVLVERESQRSVKNMPRTDLTEKQANSAPISFVQTSSQARSRDGEVLVRFRASASEQDKNGGCSDP